MKSRQSLYEHAGGAAPFERLAEAHYRRCLTDPLLTPQFGTVARPEHAARLAAWLAEVFGGPPTPPRLRQTSGASERRGR